MIKKFKSKFLICLFLLVTVFSVTSSCFAIDSAPFNVDDIFSLDSFISANETLGRGLNASNSKVVIYMSSSTRYKFLVMPNSVAYMKSNDSNTYIYMYDNNNNKITNKYLTISGSYKDGEFSIYTDDGTYSMYGDCANGSINTVKSNSTVKVLNSDGSVYFEPAPQMSVDVEHVFQSDTSAKVNFTVNNAPEGAILKYSLTGVELNTDLTAPLELKNPVTYTPRSNKFSC